MAPNPRKLSVDLYVEGNGVFTETGFPGEVVTFTFATGRRLCRAALVSSDGHQIHAFGLDCSVSAHEPVAVAISQDGRTISAPYIAKRQPDSPGDIAAAVEELIEIAVRRGE